MFDAREMQDYLEQDPDRLVRAVVVWHLLAIFDGYTLEVAPGQTVTFDGMSFGDVMQLLGQIPSTAKLPAMESWIVSNCKTTEKVLGLWMSLTEKALAAPTDCPCLVFFDQAELLALRGEGEWSTRAREVKSALTGIFSRLFGNMGCFCAGTLNLIKDFPAEDLSIP